MGRNEHGERHDRLGLAIRAFWILAVLPLLLGLLPAEIARRKGRSFAGFWLFGIVFLPFALTAAILVRERRE